MQSAAILATYSTSGRYVCVTEAEATLVRTDNNHKLLVPLKLVYLLLTQTEIIPLFTQ